MKNFRNEKLFGVFLRFTCKILYSKVNFSIKTISNIEDKLGIEVFQAAALEV